MNLQAEMVRMESWVKQEFEFGQIWHSEDLATSISGSYRNYRN
jgi:hypothetical protein